MSEKLRIKPRACPFCGRPLASERVGPRLALMQDIRTSLWYVYCKACPASGPTAIDAVSAVEAWNRRPTEER